MSITLEEFRASILAPWHGDQSAACAAAAQAMFAAKAKRGTILVAVADAAAQKAVIAYLARASSWTRRT